jgi:hypothetical protein
MGVKKSRSPEGATDLGYGVIRIAVCRRFAASRYSCAMILGLTPQAMHISPLRGWLNTSEETQTVAFREFLERTG